MYICIYLYLPIYQRKTVSTCDFFHLKRICVYYFNEYTLTLFAHFSVDLYNDKNFLGNRSFDIPIFANSNLCI